METELVKHCDLVRTKILISWVFYYIGASVLCSWFCVECCCFFRLILGCQGELFSFFADNIRVSITNIYALLHKNIEVS